VFRDACQQAQYVSTYANELCAEPDDMEGLDIPLRFASYLTVASTDEDIWATLDALRRFVDCKYDMVPYAVPQAPMPTIREIAYGAWLSNITSNLDTWHDEKRLVNQDIPMRRGAPGRSNRL
jgi:hypothetical protein